MAQMTNVRNLTAADDAGLGGVYMAWLSDESNDPNTRFTPSTVKYVLPDCTRTVIANDYTDLTSGSLRAAINVFEDGTAYNADTDGTFFVLTATKADGDRADGGYCTDWVNISGGTTAGQLIVPDATWSFIDSPANCIAKYRLYCFEQ